MSPGFDGEPFESILGDWLPLSYALNAVNRSMGRDDLSPFLLNPPVIEKLAWSHCVALWWTVRSCCDCEIG